MATIVKPKRGRRLSVLAAISLCCAGSATVNGFFAGRAALAAIPSLDRTTVGASSELVCDPDMPSALAQALVEREEAVSSRERELQGRLVELENAKQQIAKQIAEMDAAKESLDATIATASIASENDLAQLVRVYEAMKPVKAAELFAEMPPEFAAGFLARMEPTAAAGIMTGLDANAAFAISAHVAGRNASIPLE